jgi:NET1-associated nuclear protein 1 (U3 small nucleolar RNA-associated protein 17)
VQEGEGSGEGVESAGPEAWGVSLVVGSTVPRLPPVFTKNAEYVSFSHTSFAHVAMLTLLSLVFPLSLGRHFFLANNNTIRVHSASTSQPISTLSIGQDAHTAAITAYTLNPSNPLQLVTSSLDGSLKVWDYLDGSLVRTINLPGPVTHIVAGQEGSWYAATNSKGGKQYSSSSPHWLLFYLLAFVAKFTLLLPPGTTKGIQSTIWKVDFSLPKPSTDSSKSSRSSHTKIQRIRPCSGLLLSSSGSFLVALGEKKAYCIRTSDLTIGFTKFVSPNLLTCGAFHPTENWFATGDSQGLVRLWYCLSDVAQSAVGRGAGGEQERMVDVEKARRTPTQTLHWHAHAVSAVAFNAAGTSVLSVGQEATLVVWSVATGGKEFAPRLGGPLISVASRPPGEAREEESWVGLDDGSVKKVGGDGRGGRTIKGGFECSKIGSSFCFN